MKTLKDLEIQSLLSPNEIREMVKKYDPEIMLLYNQGANDLHFDLRKIAREWIHHLDTSDIMEFPYTYEDFFEEHYTAAEIKDILKAWIKHFFNLDDEEGSI